MKQLHLTILLVFIALLSGCTKEDLSNCQTIHYLTFEYTKNRQGIDLFSSQVKVLNIYVFDEEGKYVKQFSDEGTHLSATSYAIPINLPAGKYTFVVWGGMKKSYQISDKSNNSEQPLQPSVTCFDHSRLSLSTIDPNKDFPEDLYFGIARQVTINAKGSHTHIQLVKNTNTIYFVIDGLQNIRQNANNDYYDVICHMANGELRFDNSISLPEKLFQYTPAERIETENTLTFKIKALRLLTDMKSELILKNTTTGKEILNKNLIDLLLLSPEINNNEDLDINDEYHIALSIDTNLSIKITINGYTVLDSDHDIQ